MNRKEGKQIGQIVAEYKYELDTFTVTFDTQIQEEETLFCYGTNVNDFCALTKDRIFAYGIGAIQDLSKKVISQQQEIDTLKQNYADLVNILKQKNILP